MQFTKRLRPAVMAGEITTSIGIWQKPHVKVGGRYPMGAGHIEVTSMREIAMDDVTAPLARASGFDGVVDLLKTAKHGAGERIYLIDFVYREGRPNINVPRPSSAPRGPRRSASR